MRKQSLLANVFVTFLLGYLIAISLIDLANLYPAIREPLCSHFTVFSSILEELLKYIICLYVIYKIKDNPWIFLPLVGLGFGFTEQMHRYVGAGYFPWMPFVMHIALGLIMTLLLYRAKKHKSFIFYSLALIIPAFVHISYNIYIITLFTN